MKKTRQKKPQVQLSPPKEFKGMKGHGGRRQGAGRPSKSGFISHIARPRIKRSTAIHVNLHLKDTLRSINIRTKDFFKLFRLAVGTARKKGLKIVHYSLMHNHLHFILEASNNAELSRGMQSFALSLSRLVNSRTNAQIKKLWNDRYFMRLLLSPKEIRTALQYVLKNPHKKFQTSTVFDVYSSVLAMNECLIEKLFPDLKFHPPKELVKRFEVLREEVLHPPDSYLLRRELGCLA